MQIKLPDTMRIKLENGLTVIIMPVKHLPLVTFRMLFPFGAASDHPGLQGSAHLTAELLNKGSRNYDAQAFVNEVESIGGILEASSNLDYSIVVGEFLSHRLEAGLKLMAEMILHPEFPPEEVEKEKRKITGEITGRLDNPSYLVDLHFRKLLHKNHPYGNPVEGYMDSISSINREKIVSDHRGYYKANGAILVVVGDVKPGEIERLIRKYFENWNLYASSANAAITSPPDSISSIRLVNKPEMSQVQIRLGAIGITRKNPDYFPVIVMNSILGGSFASRLVTQIRVKRGLSYSAWSRFSMRIHRGEFAVGTFTKNSSVAEVINLILGELRKMQSETAGEEEIKRVKEYITGLFPFSLEPPEGIARMLSEIEFYGLEQDYLAQYCASIQSVTSDQINEAAKKYLPVKTHVIVAVGEASQIQKSLEAFGPVEVWQYDRYLSKND